MGIDVYMKWDGQTEEEHDAQITGFSTEAGNVGYLRESYHGAPYATRVLVPEAFEERGHEDGPRIPYETLKERLPKACLAAVLRNAVVYNEEPARTFLCERGLEPRAPNRAKDHGTDILAFVTDCFKACDEGKVQTIPDAPGIDLKFCLEAAEKFPEVQSLMEFVALANLQEKQTGKPVRVYASW